MDASLGLTIRATTSSIRFLCDNARHLICEPYSIENLHRMAQLLGIKRCWFHKDHYDIPKTRIAEITAKCTVVSSREIVYIIQNHSEKYFRPFLGTRYEKYCPRVGNT